MCRTIYLLRHIHAREARGLLYGYDVKDELIARR